MQNIDWKSLPFGYTKTNVNVRVHCHQGKWGDIEMSESENINIHMASTSLHYGQQVFEGLKAYRDVNGKIRLFRWKENAKRMRNSAKGVLMPEVPEELFEKCIKKAVKANQEFIPPYGNGATLYIRPLLIGIGPEVGVRPSKNFLFVVFVTPVGPYFKEGFKTVSLLICRDHDRSAPLGTGKYKVGGNYAASLVSLKKAQDLGYDTTLYLDAKEKIYIDEAGPANFFAIKGNKYITPKSNSILPSITNMSLMDIARDIGMEVEIRPVKVEELSEFDEVGACGTAAVISPIRNIDDREKNVSYNYCKNGEPGEVCKKLYQRLIDIQFGNKEDKFGWIDYIE